MANRPTSRRKYYGTAKEYSDPYGTYHGVFKKDERVAPGENRTVSQSVIGKKAGQSSQSWEVVPKDERKIERLKMMYTSQQAAKRR
jgi:hypothetical protein